MILVQFAKILSTNVYKNCLWIYSQLFFIFYNIVTYGESFIKIL